MNDTVLVGEMVAGEAAKVRKTINALIQGLSSNTFDLAEALHQVKSGKFYLAYGFDTFGEYAKSLDLRTTKSYYLVKIVQTMSDAGITREQYEPLGIAKLRVISKLDIVDKEGKACTFNGLPMADYVKELAAQAKEMPLEDVEKIVAQLQGKTGDNEQVWLNINVSKATRDNVIVPALSLAKNHIGTVGQDSDGVHKEASDGAALEGICADYLADPANGYEPPAPVTEIMKDGQLVAETEEENQ